MFGYFAENSFLQSDNEYPFTYVRQENKAKIKPTFTGFSSLFTSKSRRIWCLLTGTKTGMESCQK
jgi:hypothetical protein